MILATNSNTVLTDFKDNKIDAPRWIMIVLIWPSLPLLKIRMI